MSILQKKFDEFAKACFAESLPRQQYIDLRRTFFGGAASMYDVLMGGLSEEKESTAEDFALIIKVQAELIQFNEAVKRREA